MRTMVILAAFLLACGGSNETHKPADMPATVTTASAAATTTPPLFSGSYDLVKMAEGSKSLLVADMMKQFKDGRMTWEFADGKFTVGLWQASVLSGTPPELSVFCRATGTVASHWEGTTLVLASPVWADSLGAAVRVQKKTSGAETTKRVAEDTAHCAASYAGTRITFEIIEKDDAGPTKLRASGDGATFDLVRGKPASSIQPKTLFAD
jgi:hypothetical protein